MQEFLPEGFLLETAENRRYTESLEGLRAAQAQNRVLEARAVRCSAAHDLYVQLGEIQGVLERARCAWGLTEGTVRDVAVLSRVGKPVCFRVAGFRPAAGGVAALLDRRSVQEDCLRGQLARLRPGDVLDAVVTRSEPFGAFCDIGAGIAALLPIDSICVSRIPHPDARFSPGQRIRAVVRGRDALGRILLTHKELLGTWLENAARFSPGETVPGIVRSCEPYGIFIELAPNLAGLAEPTSGVRPGDGVSVYIKSIQPERMKVKLAVVDRFPAPVRAPACRYPDVRRLTRWVYSPPDCKKRIETVFSEIP